MDLILNKVEKYILEHDMLPKGSHVVAGVSGGADSMCLLFVLMTLKERLGLSLCAVHVHHGIRGADADKDAHFVENFCKTHGILWKTYYGDIPKLARSKKISEEEAGRGFRYECFQRALTELGWSGGRIAVAHNKNDVVETFLMNIFRGSGLYGLASIPPVRGNIIRPLLFLERREIEAFLREAKIDYRTDKTNLENDYTRNKLRNELIPYIIDNINARAVPHMFDLACEAKMLGAYIKAQSQRALEAALRPDGSLDAAVLQSLEPVLVREILRQKIERTAGQLKDITRGHIEQTVKLLEKPVGKEVHLPYGLTVRRSYDALVFFKETCGAGGKNLSKAQDFDEIILEIPGNTGIISSADVSQEGIQVEMTLKDAELFQRIEENQYTKWLDYDKIKDGLKLRHRRSGDYLVIDRRGGQKPLRRWMIDEKIPREERDKVLLIADGSHIVWIVGSRISEAYKITSQTKKILEIKIKGEE